ncbi:hypothetical protein L4C39_19455 [Vibrio clamense]|uniref:virulence factor TspB C-terminal domain-related protein n=1 Tax=Vibrio clamense TaxID=2910254 RepID=UPI003D256147
MSIKQSITFLFLFLGVSFNALAGFTGYKQLSNVSATGKLCSMYNGQILYFTNDLSTYCSGSSSGYDLYGVQISRYGFKMASYSSRPWDNLATLTTVQSCAPDEELDPVTGQCVKPPPVCTDDEVLDPDTGECKEIPFCERQSTLDAIFSEEQACAASKGIFNHSCDEFLDKLEMKCTQPTECVIGMPNYPDCLGDLNPTDPLTPPDDFNPDPSNPSTPAPPSFDKDEPDSVTPDDTTDKAVLTALQNLNRDNNKAFTALNTDLNTGFTSLDNKLKTLNKSNDAIGKAIKEQSQQDVAIHNAQTLLMTQQTGAIMNGTTQVVQGLNTQTTQLKGSLDGVAQAIGNLPSQLNGDVTSQGCSSFNCTGSAPSCFLAKERWRVNCDELKNEESATEQGALLTDTFQALTESATDEHGAYTSVFTDANGSVDEMLDAYTSDNGFSFSSGCPSPRTYDLKIAVWSIDYTPFCTLALVFRGLLLASASIASFLMVAKFM